MAELAHASRAHTLPPASVVHVSRTACAVRGANDTVLLFALSAHVPDFTVVNVRPSALTAICKHLSGQKSFSGGESIRKRGNWLQTDRAL
jgi:hypothetical protein